MKKKREDPPLDPVRQKVLPSDSIEMVIAKLREEATWFPEDGKTWALLIRAADELEERTK